MGRKLDLTEIDKTIDPEIFTSTFNIIKKVLQSVQAYL